jgi:hypothetical protein
MRLYHAHRVLQNAQNARSLRKPDAPPLPPLPPPPPPPPPSPPPSPPPPPLPPPPLPPPPLPPPPLPPPPGTVAAHVDVSIQSGGGGGEGGGGGDGGGEGGGGGGEFRCTVFVLRESWSFRCTQRSHTQCVAQTDRVRTLPHAPPPTTQRSGECTSQHHQRHRWQTSDMRTSVLTPLHAWVLLKGPPGTAPLLQ